MSIIYSNFVLLIRLWIQDWNSHAEHFLEHKQTQCDKFKVSLSILNAKKMSYVLQPCSWIILFYFTYSYQFIKIFSLFLYLSIY